VKNASEEVYTEIEKGSKPTNRAAVVGNAYAACGKLQQLQGGYFVVAASFNLWRFF